MATGERDRVLATDRANVARILPELQRPAESVAPLPARPELDAGDVAAQGRLFGAVLGVLARAADLRPLLVIVEDLHWADEASRDLFRYVCRALRSELVLLVGTYRSDELVRLHPLRGFLADVQRLALTVTIDLRPFERDEVTEQLEAITGAPVDVGVVDRIVQRSTATPSSSRNWPQPTHLAGGPSRTRCDGS